MCVFPGAIKSNLSGCSRKNYVRKSLLCSADHPLYDLRAQVTSGRWSDRNQNRSLGPTGTRKDGLYLFSREDIEGTNSELPVGGLEHLFGFVAH
jgi:hypothetical protein